MVYTITKVQEVVITSPIKNGSVWKQLLLTFLGSIPYFSHGVQTAVLMASAHSGHFIKTATLPDSVPWSTIAMAVAAVVSAPFYSIIIDKFGRKKGLFILTMSQGVSCVFLFLTKNDVNIVLLHIFAGISSSGLFTVLPIYIREINNNKNRPLSLGLMIVMTSGGYLMKLVMELEVVCYLVTGLVVLQMLSMFILLETPTFYVIKGQYEMAKSNEANLSCLNENDKKVNLEVKDLELEMENANANGRVTILTILTNLIWRDAIKIGLVLHSVGVLSGSILFLDQSKTLQQLRLDVDPDSSLVLLCLFAGSFICSILIRVVERKYLLVTGYTIMVVSMGILAIYTQADLTISSLHWVPFICLGVLLFGYGIAWGLPYVIMTEILNLKIRSSIIAFLFIYTQIIRLAHVLTYQYIEDYVGAYAMLYIFAGVNIYGAVYTLFGVPDLQNKSVKQIEKQLKRVPII